MFKRIIIGITLTLFLGCSENMGVDSKSYYAMKEKQVHEEAKLAFEAGIPYDGNPYNHPAYYRIWWFNGWAKAKVESGKNP